MDYTRCRMNFQGTRGCCEARYGEFLIKIGPTSCSLSTRGKIACISDDMCSLAPLPLVLTPPQSHSQDNSMSRAEIPVGAQCGRHPLRIAVATELY